MHLNTTNVVTNIPAPNNEPIAISTPSDFPPAANDVITSGAPLANAKSVTPASDSEKLNFLAIYERAGDKYASAVVERRWNIIAINII